MKSTRFLSSIIIAFGLCGIPSVKAESDKMHWTENQLEYCSQQIGKTLRELPNDSVLPRSIDAGAATWTTTNNCDWTSGFWPGILWYNYEYSNKLTDKLQALAYTEHQRSLANEQHNADHDIGFQLLCSFGHAYANTGRTEYKEILLAGADKLAQLYNPNVGTILSWPHAVKNDGWPHNTIMDNMMNLQLLFFAAQNGGPKEYKEMAVSHARKTMQNQFRDDFTSYHVALYDSISGNFIRGCTNQGYSDESFWARGQAWGIYGFTVVYRETGDKEFLRFVEKIADVYLRSLPQDYVPYWDFLDPSVPNTEKDASSAAIVASALIELARIEDDDEKADRYIDYAYKMLRSLSSDQYQSRNQNSAFLMHSTGNKPAGYEIDSSINYADYYYIEALSRYRTFLENEELKAHETNKDYSLSPFNYISHNN